MSYQPAPGSVPFRVLAHMELLHQGSEITSARLAEGAMVESTALMISSMDAALSAGLIFRRKKGGHIRSPIFWSLVDHSKDEHAAPPPGPQTPIPKVADPYGMTVKRTAEVKLNSFDAAVDQLTAVARHAIAFGSDVPKPFSADLNGHFDPSKPEPKPEVEPMTASECEEAEGRFTMQLGAFDNGTLHVIRNGKLDVWSAQHFRQLVRFLDAISLDAVRDEE